MEAAFKILNDMEATGIFARYAVCGAMAAFEYIEPMATRDIDVTIEIGPILSLSQITSFLEKIGHPVQWEAEGLMIAGFPLQFIPVADPLDKDALENSVKIESCSIAISIWRQMGYHP